LLCAEKENKLMAKKAVDCDGEMPEHPLAPKTVAKKASARGGVNSFIKGGGKKGKKGRRKRVKK
jgi:hypothetical protein